MTQKDKVVVVTGAASGIGFACALAYGGRGARIALLDLDPAPLETARKNLDHTSVDCIAIPCDVSDPAAMQAAAELVTTNFGSVDILINNAGIGYLGPFLDTPLDAWSRVLAINVMGVVHGIRAFLPLMLADAKPRTIVNVASAAGFAPTPSMTAYAASKHAVVGLSESLAMELDGSNVDILIVAPGVINTNIVRVSRNIAPSVSENQVRQLQAYYQSHGCAPALVAEGIVATAGSGRPVLAIGPSARLMTGLIRLSRRLARRLVTTLSRKVGYL